MSFQGYLRQATAVDVLIGPFVDSTDGDTAEESLTITASDVRLSENGGTVHAKNDSTTCVHDEKGFYNCELDATDTATCGQLFLFVHESGALAVTATYHVVEEAVYDAMFGASSAGPLQATTAGRTLDVTATGAAGIDWGNIENKTSTVALTNTSAASLSGAVGSVTGAVGSVTGAVGSVTGNVGGSVGSVVGHTAQTGDSFARLGAPGGASLSADVAAIPTTPMRGTDGANTTTPDAAGTAAALHTTTDAAVALIPTTPMRGTDGANTTTPDAAGTAAALHAITDAAVALIPTTPMRGTDGANTTTPDAAGTAAVLHAITDGKVDAVWTTALTAAWRATGAEGTAAQLLYEILGHLAENGNVGTTKTIYELDGTTPAKTYTYDDATSPTSITETT